MKKFIAVVTLFLLAVCLFAQSVPEGPNTNPTAGPPMNAFSKLLFRDGSGNVQYVCVAKSLNHRTSLAITGATNASPIVITTATHGLQTDNVVTISGVAGNTAANGTWIITVVSSTTFSLNNSTGNGVYTSGGTTFTTAPRSNDSVWAIQKFYYTGTSLDRFGWSNAATAMNAICDNRASLIFQ